MLPNCSGFYKEGKVTISAGLCYFHQDFLVKHRKTVLFTSNTKVENKNSQKVKSFQHEKSDGKFPWKIPWNGETAAAPNLLF